MTIFNTLQFPAFGGVSKVTQSAAPQLSLPDDEAIQVFQRTYERPKELPQPVELPIALGSAIPAGGEEPYPTRLASASAPADGLVSAREAGRLGYESRTPVAAERPAELPLATPATLAKVVAENLTLAKELPQPVELQIALGSAIPAGGEEPYPTRLASASAPADGPVSAREAGRLGYESRTPVAAERPAELPPATSETVPGVVSAVVPTVNTQEAAPVGGVAEKVSAEVPRTASSIVLEAALAVADTLLVSPHLMRGDGEIRVQLKPDVLDGAQICIKVMGKSMQVEFASVTDDIARLMTEAQPQLIRRLAEKMPTYEVAVTILPGNMTARRRATKDVGRSGEEV